MNDLKSICNKLILTVPALIVGIFSVLIIILRPTIELWNPKPISEPTQEEIPEDKIENHTFV